MKKRVVVPFLIVVLFASSFLVACQSNRMYQLIRIHIVAHSNSSQDQRAKYAVRDYLVDRLTVELQDVSSRQEAYDRLHDMQHNINIWVNNVLFRSQVSYLADVSITNKFFPVRIYQGFVVDSGYYDAMIIVLGDGLGNNWWCVVYPPLCFIAEDSGSWQYRSILVDLWNRFFGR